MNEKSDSIPEMKLDKKYNNARSNKIQENSTQAKKEMDKVKKELEKLKDFILKKYKFTESVSLLPPQIIPKFVEEEEVPKETEKYPQLLMIIPEGKYKGISKIKQEIVKEIDKLKEKIWLQIKTPIDLWEYCFDSKFDLVEGISMSFPLYDKGMLESLRLTSIHKSLVVQKFEKYVVSYVLGGSLVRGDVKKTSDIDVVVIINDTDVKRMPRLELKERLRYMIAGEYSQQAGMLAGVKKNVLNVQVYLLTEFWESVKDANPVMFTFIRDGVPIYDRGTFMPWKALLKMGKLKPSPEAIDMFMSLGDNALKRSKKSLLDVVINELYWGVVTPSQALLMLNGSPPPAPKHLVKEFEHIFLTKEKLLEKRYINILAKIVGIYKDYEHEKVKEIKGEKLDKLIKDTENYVKRLKELREQIEKRYNEKTIEQSYNDTFELLKQLIKEKSRDKIISEFEKKFVKTGKFSYQHLRILKDIISARAEFKKGKSDSHKIDNARKNASLLINDLIEFSQRCELANLEKGKINLKYTKDKKEKIAEVFIGKNKVFLVDGKDIKKITNKIQKSNLQELTKELEDQKNEISKIIDPKIFDLIKKELGSFEIIL